MIQIVFILFALVFDKAFLQPQSANGTLSVSLGCYWLPWCFWQSWTSRPLCKCFSNVMSTSCSCGRAQSPGWFQAVLYFFPHRATLDLPDLLDHLARRDPKETVVRLDLLVALVRLVPLDPQDLLERRVAPVLRVLL